MQRHLNEEEIYEWSGGTEVSADLNSGLIGHKNSLVNLPKGANREEISEVVTSPEAAFSVFNGKVFYPPKQEVYSLADSIERRVESPLQRFNRLRCELDDLLQDLNSIGVVNEQASVWSALQKEAQSMKSSLQSLSAHKGLILNDQAAAEKLAELKSTCEGESKGVQISIANSGQLAATKDDVSTLELRIFKLEAALGINGSAAQNAHIPSFSTTLGRLEEKVAMLNETEVEALRVKYEAIQKEVTTSTLKAKSNATQDAKITEATKQLGALLNLTEKVDSVAGDLPVLVTRLKTLEKIHHGAATLHNRVHAIEGDIQALTGEVSSNREVLAALKQCILENVSTLEQNVSALKGQQSNT